MLLAGWLYGFGENDRAKVFFTVERKPVLGPTWASQGAV